MSENLQKLKSAIQQAASRPKGILVSQDLFREMSDAGLIEKKISTPWGLPASEIWQVQLPYHEDIYVHLDPFRSPEDAPFELPPSSKRA